MKNKKGISLIVLIVTIIVIIILAAAVILTLNKNNPIDSSRVAQLADNRATINSGLQLYYGKVMAEYQGILDSSEIFTGTTTKKDPKDNATAITLTSLVTGSATNSKNYQLNTTNLKSELDIQAPNMSGATWYIDVNSGLVYLVYADYDAMPSWMFKDTTKSLANMDSTLAEFVKTTADLATL